MQHVGHRASDEIAQLRQTNEKLRALVTELSNALADEGPQWSDGSLDRLRREVAASLAPAIPEWLLPYRVTAA